LYKPKFLILGISLCIFITGVTYFWFYTVEDAYISFRYSDNFLNGHGLSYNEGDRVEGYTNFLWVLILCIPRIFFPFPVIAKVLGALLSIASLISVFCLTSQHDRDRWAGPAAALMLACCPGFQMWSIAGLETPLFIFLLVFAVLCDLRLKKYAELSWVEYRSIAAPDLQVDLLWRLVAQYLLGEGETVCGWAT